MKTIHLITEIVEGGKPTNRYVESEKAQLEFDKMVSDLGYERDDNHAWAPGDADRNSISLDTVEIPD